MPKITFKTELDGTLVTEIWSEKIKEAMNEVIKGEMAKSKAEAKIAKAKQDLAIIIPLLGLEDNKIKTTTQGVFSFVGPSTSSSFKKDIAKTRLVEEGIDIDLVNSVWEEATLKSPRQPYVKWDKPKVKKEKK